MIRLKFIVAIITISFSINLHAATKQTTANDDRKISLKSLLNSVKSSFDNITYNTLTNIRFYNRKEKQILYKLLEDRIISKLVFMSSYPNFARLDSPTVNPNVNARQNIDPYANNRLYVNTLDGLVTGDLRYLWRLYESLKNKKDVDERKRQEIIDALKSRAEKIIDMYPISKIENIRGIEDIGEMIAFTHHIRTIYEFPECTDFVAKEIQHRLKILQRRNTPEVLLFPLKVILFSAKKIKTLSIRKNDRWKRIIIITFIKNNSRVKLSQKQIEKLLN